MKTGLCVKKCSCDDACASYPNIKTWIFTDNDIFSAEIYVDRRALPSLMSDHIEISDNELYTYALKKCIGFFDNSGIEITDKSEYEEGIVSGGLEYFNTAEELEDLKAKGINTGRYTYLAYTDLFDGEKCMDIAEEAALAHIDLSNDKIKDIRYCLLYLMCLTDESNCPVENKKYLEKSICEQMKSDCIV